MGLLAFILTNKTILMNPNKPVDPEKKIIRELLLNL